MRTSELTGALLDLWVARAMKLEPIPGEPDGFFYWGACSSGWWCPSANWEQAGPIIERERIQVAPTPPFWLIDGKADMWWGRVIREPVFGARQFGETALVAAMRAYVISVYGATVPDQPGVADDAIIDRQNS